MQTPLKILVVEDFEPFRQFIRTSIGRRMEASTIEVSNGREAIEKAEVLQPDLILLDIRLPGLSGLDVAREIPGISPQSRMLFISQEMSPDVIGETLRLGALGYVHKLRCHEDLMPAIDAALQGQHFVSSVLGGDHRCHEVQFYSEDAVLTDAFARFAGARLVTGQGAIVLATERHQEEIVQQLIGFGIDVDAAILRGSYLALDAAATLDSIMVNGVPDRTRFFEGLDGLINSTVAAADAEHPRVAICGECVGLLCEHGNLDAALFIEETGNDLVKAHDVDILCGYPLPRWGDDGLMFRDVCAKHSAVRYR